MKLSVFCVLWCLTRLAPAQAPACEIVEGENITAKDLARAVGSFAVLPPDTVVGFAPLPGAQRVLRGAEILQLARRHSLTLATAPDVCFTWAMEPLDRNRVMEAMRSALELPDATIKIIDTSLYAVPRGEIIFAADRLGVPARPDRPSPVLWRGDVIYGGGRRFAVWARVEITAPVTHIVALAPLKSGEPILPNQIRIETTDSFPAARKLLTLDAVIGMLPARTIPAGGEIRSIDLTAPKAINSGDSVEIEVRTGSTRLAFTGVAVTPGSVGDTISVRNPESKKTFRAQVTGKGTAIVQPAWTRSN